MHAVLLDGHKFPLTWVAHTVIPSLTTVVHEHTQSYCHSFFAVVPYHCRSGKRNKSSGTAVVLFLAVVHTLYQPNVSTPFLPLFYPFLPFSTLFLPFFYRVVAEFYPFLPFFSTPEGRNFLPSGVEK